MPFCPQCQSEHPDPDACPTCGHPVDDLGRSGGAGARRRPVSKAPDTPPPEPAEEDLAGTRPVLDLGGDAPRAPAVSAHAPRYPGSVEPGDLIAHRYRILSRLGAGNMGTVYHARDEQLDADVALKFLTAQCAIDADCAAQLTQEVRVARQVSHENVCRVHDLGSHEGRQFVSMEFIPGVDLGRRLAQTDPLPAADRDRIARQLCAGLHAVHARGILHCDLKPANVLLDQRGNVRIVDFGIAAAIGADRGDRIAGSPAYMAPEVLAGSPNTTASDIYSLGLLLYELYCGEPWIQGDSLTEIFDQHRRPSHLRPGNFAELDRSRERLIRAMTATDPKQRPSALDVLARLPGGDPLATALATGSTPSPELVAAAGGATLIRRRTAWLLVLVTVSGLLLAGVLGSVRTIESMVAIEGLEARAVELIAALGSDGADGGENRMASGATLASHLEMLDAVPLAWFRTHDAAASPRNVKGRVRFDDPTFAAPGMMRLRLQLDGTLRSFEALPRPTARPTAPPPDWPPLLRAAGLVPERLTSAEPPPPPHRIPSTHQFAWNGRTGSGTQFRVEAASFGSTVVLLTVTPSPAVAPTTSPADGAGVSAHRPDPDPASSAQAWRSVLSSTLMWIALAMAWWNWRHQSSDTRSAFRLAITTVVMVLAFTLLAGDRDGTPLRWMHLLQGGLGHGLLVGGQLAVCYLALEPHVRRFWPEILIAWSRLLAGHTRDSLVGYHLLIGAAIGVAMALVRFQGGLLERALDPQALGPAPTEAGLLALDGALVGIGAMLELAIDRTRVALLFLFGLVLLRILLRRRIAAAVLTILIFTVVFHQPGAQPTWKLLGLVVTLITVTVFTIQAVRFGVLSVLVSLTLMQVLVEFPLRFWSSATAFWVVLPVLALTGTLLFHGYLTATREAPERPGAGTGRFTRGFRLPWRHATSPNARSAR